MRGLGFVFICSLIFYGCASNKGNVINFNDCVTCILRKDMDKNLAGAVTVYTVNVAGSIIWRGSGQVISKDGLIVTAFHITDYPFTKKIIVRYTKNGVLVVKIAEIVKTNPKKDLAIIKINGAPDVNLRIRTSPLVSGEAIYTLGYPAFDTPEGNRDRPVAILGQFIKSYWTESAFHNISTNTHLCFLPISRASSGGAVFDAQGNLIGIAVLAGPYSEKENSFTKAIDGKYISKMLTEIEFDARRAKIPAKK